MILFRCKCGEELEAAEDEAGQLLMCPICRARVRAPRPNQETESSPAQAVSPSTAIQTSPGILRPTLSTEPTTNSDAPAPPYSRWASASLVLGLLSFVVPILSLPGIIVGVMGLAEIRRGDKRLGGVGLAIAGIFCSILSPLLIVVLVLAVQKVRQEATATVSRNNLRMIALAMDAYHDVHKAFPQQAIYSADGRPLLSWRVAILGYIEQHALYLQFKLDEPWDSPHNKALLFHMPAIYKVPGGPGDQSGDFSTGYQGFVGKNAFFRSSPRERVALSDITDGAASTLMIVEAAQAVPWTKPEDLPLDPDKALPELGWSLPGGCQAVLVDGTVVRIDPDRVSAQTLRRAITINDGQPLGLDWPVR